MFKKGFTLMEVMLSLLLVGTVLVAILVNTSVMVRGVDYGDKLAQAVVIATNVMEDTGYRSGRIPTSNMGAEFNMTRSVKRISQTQKTVTIDVFWPHGSYRLQRDFFQGVL